MIIFIGCACVVWTLVEVSRMLSRKPQSFRVPVKQGFECWDTSGKAIQVSIVN